MSVAIALVLLVLALLLGTASIICFVVACYFPGGLREWWPH